ncbi:alpha/beta-Hydrolase [Glarea lozoyensis ATCC 20868]|uniref:Alpha/beta-Hydrolase n=1 Tax=Glarea lozoyensis (strain ATCC 20868 / MF5171) TaxID=1116229 RepID=S3DFV5_GLAL2|nr:alpha/beta-Hydrolase [Glarea lozoyensis ATCC 20868]EPE30856.1 alpha/beta-Hydrolase [Glarea lozoyensis ATCC 20868]
MGIQVLYPIGEDAEDIDINLNINLELGLTPDNILAIHGLNGNPLNTWTEPKSQKLWFRDFLPKDIPNARIMTFGYDATAAFERSTAGILEHARDLLRCVEETRINEQERNRPILFCAHSLGGLVLKQALLVAAETGHKHYKPIWENTIGVLFFGTPHRGSSLAAYGAQLARVPTALSMKPTPQLLESLSTGSFILGELNGKFRKLMDKNRGSREIASFYETRTMLAWRSLVVEQASALINPPECETMWETPIPVAADHRDMCRFSSTDNPAYKTAVRTIQRLRRGNADEEITNQVFLVPQALSKDFTGRNDIRTLVTAGLIDQNYQKKKEQKRLVLWGLGGSGKTQICLKIANDYRNRFWGIFFIDGSSINNAIKGFDAIAKALKIRVSQDPLVLVEDVREHLATRPRWMLIIDNADDPDLDLWQFIPLSGNSSILITTRNRAAVKYATTGSTTVERMSEKDAMTLLLKSSGLDNMLDLGNNCPAHHKKKETALKIVRSLGFLALAIIQAGAAIRQRFVSLEDFSVLYTQRKKDLLESGRSKEETGLQCSVYTTWEISIKMIEAVNEKHSVLALEILQYFAFMHFDGITEQSFEMAWRESTRQGHVFFSSVPKWMQTMPDEWDQLLIGRALALLLSFCLITMDADRRVSIHPLVHQWSLERMIEIERREVWLETIVTITAAISWSPGVEGFTHRKSLLPHLDACRNVYAFDLSGRNPHVEAHLSAALSFALIYRENNRINDSIKLTKQCLDSVEANLPASQSHYIPTLKCYAADLSHLGKYDELAEIWQKILKLEEISFAEPEIVAQSLIATATANILIGRHQKAIELCRTVQSDFRETLEHNNTAILEAAEVIGYAKKAMGQPREALKHLEKCLEVRVQTRVGHPTLQEIELVEQLTDLYNELKRSKKARSMAERRVEIYSQIYGPDDRATVAAKVAFEETRHNSGMLNIRRRARCIGVSEKACAFARQQDQGEPSINTLFSMEQLARVYCDCGLLEKAKLLQEEIVAIYMHKGGLGREDTVRAIKYLRRIEFGIKVRRVVYWWVPKTLRDKDWASEKVQNEPAW